MIAFQRENVVGLLVDHLLGDIALAAHRINGHDRPLDRQHVQQLGDSNDFVGFFRDLELAQHKALARGEGRNHVDRLFRPLLLIGAAQRLAVDGDDLRRCLGQRRDPSGKAALERSRVEGGENIAKVIV